MRHNNYWDLTKIFKDRSTCQKTINHIDYSKLLDFKGKLGNKKEVLNFLSQYEKVLRKIEKIFIFTHLNYTTDLKDSKNIVLLKNIEALWTKFKSDTSFVSVEFSKLSNLKLDNFIKAKSMSKYSQYFIDIKRQKKHILSDKVENILANISILWSSYKKTFSSLTDVDFSFSDAIDSNDKKYKLTIHNFNELLQSPDRNLRKSAFNNIYSEFKKFNNTISNIFSSKIQNQVIISNIRKYKTARQSSLYNNDIDEKIYDTLLRVTNANLGINKSIVKSFAKKLDITDFEYFDLFAPLVDNNEKYSYTEAVNICIEAVKPLGKDYQERMKKGLLKDGWVDIFPKENKISGAFQSGGYDTDPYILLNFTGTLNDVFTLIHEAGHAMHTYFSNKNNNYFNAGYSIFTAEIASTVNEILLFEYLYKKADKKLKEQLVKYELGGIRATFFRQVMFAEFEHVVNTLQETSTPLSPDLLNKTYNDIVSKYHKGVIKENDFIQYEWSRIPHFYNNYYVFQYATGIASAVYFVDRIKKGGSTDYLVFLSRGGSDYPVNLLKEVGLDFTEESFYDPLFDFTKDLLKKF